MKENGKRAQTHGRLKGNRMSLVDYLKMLTQMYTSHQLGRPAVRQVQQFHLRPSAGQSSRVCSCSMANCLYRSCKGQLDTSMTPGVSKVEWVFEALPQMCAFLFKAPLIVKTYGAEGFYT